MQPPPPLPPPEPPVPPQPPTPPSQPALVLDACAAQLVVEPTFASADSAAALVGVLEFGQTHVIKANEGRIHARLVGGRETLVLFTPQTPASEDAWSFVLNAVSAQGHSLGTLPLAPPSDPVGLFEQGYTSADLNGVGGEGERLKAWRTVLPARWVQEGLVVRVGQKQTSQGTDAPVIAVLEHRLEGLGAPSPFTFYRTHVVLFGDASHLPSLNEESGDAAKLALDLFPLLPLAELQWVDQAPYVLEELLVTGPNGTVALVTSEKELAATSVRFYEYAEHLDCSPQMCPGACAASGELSKTYEHQHTAADQCNGAHYNILKQLHAQRFSLAMSGEGLVHTDPWAGPPHYSHSTVVGQGWFRSWNQAPNRVYWDLNDQAVAGGWVGWAAVWLGLHWEVFPHEAGHAFTLGHFTNDRESAEQRGVADEYPNGGQHIESHPRP